MFRRSTLIACLVATCVAIGGAAPAGAYTTDLSVPIVFVHGYGLGACPGYDQGAYWMAPENFLSGRGWSGPKVPVSYYTCDTNGTSIDSHGSHSAYFGSVGHSLGSHTQNADIRHLAYHLAWFIYDTYSSHGQSVQLVGHSMGGAITRWMLYRIGAQDPNFPPYLYVQDSVTISSPHNGYGAAAANYYACAGSLQCQQFAEGSSFINELNANALNPQATNGTDWSVMGSESCDVVPPSTSLHMGAVHKVDFLFPCYDHVNYLADISTISDATVDYQNPPNSTFTRWTSAPHSLAWLDQSLRSNAW
jgi:hypothetical protein